MRTYRKKMKKSRSKKLFSRTARRVNPRNAAPARIMRGGIRF